MDDDVTSCGYEMYLQFYKSVLNAPGALRCVASRPEENNSVFCGFASGFASQVDIRTGGVVATWRAHSDAVSQVRFLCQSNDDPLLWCILIAYSVSMALF
ncbi:unnamed protein product [Hydatigera taeniaeformis]|uniref:GRAS domain-containing protein n=1 Tax=Hydatigena taeniaeformis TaxID=6205 RepID=A0A0R3WUZ0_HYDTA|nr:unnamed protein product [Hydatigera taeniaeformis]